MVLIALLLYVNVGYKKLKMHHIHKKLVCFIYGDIKICVCDLRALSCMVSRYNDVFYLSILFYGVMVRYNNRRKCQNN